MALAYSGYPGEIVSDLAHDDVVTPLFPVQFQDIKRLGECLTAKFRPTSEYHPRNLAGELLIRNFDAKTNEPLNKLSGNGGVAILAYQHHDVEQAVQRQEFNARLRQYGSLIIRLIEPDDLDQGRRSVWEEIKPPENAETDTITFYRSNIKLIGELFNDIGFKRHP